MSEVTSLLFRMLKHVKSLNSNASNRLIKRIQSNLTRLFVFGSPARGSLVDSSSISMRELSSAFNGRTVKERYHIDAYGKCIQRGSLSRLSTGNLRSSVSMQRSQSRASSATSDMLERPFKAFLDYKDDKRYTLGEGSAPLIREKLKDNFLIVGAIVTMRCRIEGNPTPRCFW